MEPSPLSPHQPPNKELPTAGYKAEGSRSLLEKLVKTSVQSLASCCLHECALMGEKQHSLTSHEQMEIQFPAQYDGRTSHAAYKTFDIVRSLCVRNYTVFMFLFLRSNIRDLSGSLFIEERGKDLT